MHFLMGEGFVTHVILLVADPPIFCNPSILTIKHLTFKVNKKTKSCANNVCIKKFCVWRGIFVVRGFLTENQ